jgi:hypothetical protein
VRSGEKNSRLKNASKPLGASDSRPNTKIAQAAELPDGVDIGGVLLFDSAEIVFDIKVTCGGYKGTFGLA